MISGVQVTATVQNAVALDALTQAWSRFLHWSVALSTVVYF